ncbi:uncharacterized protein LOC143349583 [Colletes latitarsis]|uniref:uncharacterized protein LOC143349583 n=1 Tax=Colletes latitarsis TaxID=2605962 RepID=UPI0040360074
MDVEKVSVENGKTNVTTTTFKESKRMSSYLVAFVVSDYEKKETKDEKFRVYTKPHALDQTTFALEFGEKVISKLDDYTGIKYLDKMPKIDQISIKDFTAGAMENWGLVTYRETALLYEQNVSTTRSKQSIATIIAHEFAHQWFGNLVSPKWWEYIWLNEGFANYFQYFITNQLEESWRLMEVYAVEALQGTAFVSDAKENTRPMNKAVVSPNEISNLFDNIAYQKAGSVIRMMSSILTEKIFQQRIQSYLKEYEFKIAESKNLIDHLQGDEKNTWADQKFETIMDEWINKPGYPVVTVNKTDKEVVLSQERFMLYGANNSTKWWIPITYVMQSDANFNNTTPQLWLGKTENLTIPINATRDNWIIVNTQQTGYYRVNYDVNNWKQLQKYLLTKDYVKIHPVNRAQLIDDALAMARTSRLDYAVALSLSLYLHQETDYIPWITANRHLNFFQNMLYTSKHYAMYKSYVRYLLDAVVKNVKYGPQEKDEHITKIHRANVMKWACKVEEKACLEYAEKEFEAWLKDPKTYKLDADLKSNILCYGLRSANEDKWQKTKDALSQTTADEDELNTLLAVMGCSKSLPILKKLLEQSLLPESSMDFDVAVQSVLANNPLEGFDLVLNNIVDNYEKIKQLNNSEDKIKSCIDNLGNLVVTPDQFLRLSMLNTKVGAKADTVQSTVEKSTRNINWLGLHGEAVENWLHKNEQLFHSTGSTIVLTSFLLVLAFLFTNRVNVCVCVFFYESRDTINQWSNQRARLLFQYLIIKPACNPQMEANENVTKNLVNNYRLPDDAIPIHYNIKLELTELNRITFNGEMEINFKVKRPTPNIVLNSKDITIDKSSTSVKHGNNSLKPNEHIFDDEREMLLLRFEDSLQPGTYTLHLKFIGVFGSDFCGIFTSFYEDEQGNNASVVGTHFQKTSARRAFPCWDEPALKSTFNISLKHLSNHTALSNMPAYLVEPDERNEQAWTHFETTPIMSTNILAVVVVSDFRHISSSDGRIRVWTRADRIHEAAYFLDVAERTTNELTRYFNSSVRVPKMDHVALPIYSAAASENWGLIIYIEAAAPYNTTERTQTRMLNTMTVAHEITHQWFGNLVSPSWWKYYWLSEGAATYFRYYITDKLFKSWRLMDNIIFDQMRAFSIDDSSNVHKINNDFIDRRYTRNIYSITYTKTAVIFWMMSHMIGEEVFRNGLLNYIGAHEYGSVTSDDLWEAMQSVLNKTDYANIQMKEVMDSWIEQTGYPLVTVTRNYTTGNVTIRQEPSPFSRDKTMRKWWIPINYATKSAPDFSKTKPIHWLRPSDKDITIQGIDVDDWIIVNLQHTGYYRVNYDVANWNKIVEYLNSDNYTKIHAGNRIQLIGTAWNLVNLKQLNSSIFVELINYLNRETDPVVWKYVFSHFVNMDKYLRTTDGTNILKPRIRDLMKNFVATIGYEKSSSDDDFVKLIQMEALNWACVVGDRECKQRANERLIAYIKDPLTNRRVERFLEREGKIIISFKNCFRVPPDAEYWVFCMGLKLANRSIWDALSRDRSRFKDYNVFQILSHLSCTEDPEIIGHYLNMSLNLGTTISEFTDPIDILRNIDADVPENINAEIDFIINNFDRISNAVIARTNVMDISRAGVLIIFILLFAKNRAIYRDIDAIGETFAENDRNYSTVDYRLPKTIVPINYEIILMPSYEGDFTFNGIVHINALVQQDTDTITLHHRRINITGMSVNYENNIIDISASSYDNKTEQFQLKLKKVMREGLNITINFQYTGTLRDDMIGFYKSQYFDSAGKIKWLASTQFQTTHARHAFPCFDEPSLKATFKLRILKRQDYTCLSNMPLARSIAVPDQENKYWEDFDQSIPMSTYLVAFIISDFKYLGDDKFKVWARPNAIDQARYAVSIGPKALDHLSKLFKQDYQISKMDMVAVPDFSAGAMENWGLVTYRESRLLYDEDTTSDAAKQSIAAVIVHELTHMWFGNMITFEWWSYLWLSEAFARYYQYFGTAQIEKSWSMEDQFIVEQHQTALAADGLESSKPMTRQVSNSMDVSGAGDTITYNKGASILRMMNAIFGKDVFEAGLQNYLKNNKENKVARPENLWYEFQEEINRREIKLASSVNDIMTTWTEQPGYPVLHVSIKNGVATVQQKRFLLRNLKSTATNLTWWVPITWVSKDVPNFNDMKVKYWLNKNENEVKLNTNSGWVIFNVQSTGFYRVNYDSDSWYRIIDVLNSENYQQIHVLNRAALIDDLLNLARAGLLDYATALNGVRYMKRETDYLPFKSAFTGFNYLDQRLSGNDEHYKFFKRFVLDLIRETYKKIGYLDRVNDDRLTVLLRSELNKWACNYGHEGCVETFTAMFKKWRTTKVPTIKPNQRETAYCTAIKHGSQDDWEFLWKEYSKSNSATEQSVILQALGCTQDNTIRERYLLYALQSFEISRIRRQDSTAVFSAVYGSSLSGAEFLLNFIDKYHAKMAEYYEGPSTIATILSSASQRLSTRKSVDEFENLIKKHAVPFNNILGSLRNSLDIAEYELRNFQSFSDRIASWITDNYYYRLPENIIPLEYLIDVTPHIKTFTFDGEVTIRAQVTTETNEIVLHSSEIKHDKITVSLQGKMLNINNKNTTEKYDLLTIVLSEQLKSGSEITITIKYSGFLNEEMRGFYRSSYTTSNGDTRWLAATHLEPVGARKLFPCFDEPAMKAIFAVQVTLEKGYKAISNMPIEKSTTLENGGLRINFQKTPKMSTYLVALVVSDFDYIDYNKIYKVWSRPDATNQGEYALSIMESLVKYYEKVLNIPYELPKLDMVALPDFTSGAMENWGLLTYKERNVLYSDKESTIATKQSIANVISHEISHQWFGNLVSPRWWKYLWLNEGFARYYQYFGTDNVENDWSLAPQFVVEQLHSALETDSSASSHAMTHNVYSPTEIRGIFDTISYAKGASVIRMLRELFGPDVFHKSLHNYLIKLRYDVATPNDLFDAFKQQITDKEIQDSFDNIMNTWTTQPGYPVVRFTIKNNSLHLKQERFLIEQNKNASNKETLWYVPITWTSPNKSSTNAPWLRWFYKAEDSIPLPGCNTDLCIFNDKQAGFYRTNYEDDHWRQIITFLKTQSYDKINEINRATIIDDLMNFARSGYVDYEIALSATQYLVNERNYVPWRAFFNGLTYLRRQFQGRDAFDAYKRYLTALLTPIYDAIKFEDQKNDKHERLLLRMYVRKWACELGVSDCEANAIFYFKTWYNDQTQNFPPNYRGVSYCTVARTSPSDYWDILWSLYMNTTVASHKSVILQSLACTTQTTYLNELLNRAITKNSGIRFEDSSSVFTNVIDASLEGADYAIDFIKTNYNEINNYYRGDVSKIKSIVLALAKRLSTEKLYAKYMNLIAWLEEKELSSFGSSLNTYKNRAAYELTWAENYIPKLHEWMETNYPDTDYRLPKLHSPLKYNIFLSPYFQEKNFTFTGKVQIFTRCLRNTSRIVLNSHLLKIKRVSIYKSNSTSVTGDELNVNSFVTTENTQKLTVFMKNIIRNDEIIIEIAFEGFLNDRMEGFYRSYYFNNVMNISWLATTQFEPTHARKAFPCFDEPALKATFVINIERPEKYVALSNMPIKTTSPTVSGRVWETFDETPTMSTYLVAFVVSDFKNVRNSYRTVNVWGRPNIAPNGDYAQIAAMRMLEILAVKTNQQYTLPKLDLIGIPDFSMGAMENWGLATFREYGLFYKKGVTTAKYTDYILTIIAHELAHMWFGNLVTCDWWEHIWLNEGFAEYMQWQVAHLFKPEHNFEDLFVVDELQVAMQNDDYVSSHPMNHPVSKPSEIAKVFDSIAYGKSSSVIRMIKNSLASEVFSKATQRYLREHKYSTTSPKDLWKAFDAVIKETHAFGNWKISMETLMKNWTNEAGYPIVFATLNGNTLTLTQKRFSLNQREESTKVYFWIPITMASASNVNFITTATDIWLGEKSLSIQYNPGDWFILNVQQSGYYRVNYDDNSWLNLIKALRQHPMHSSIPPTNRAQVIDDLLNLARGSYINYNLALNGTTYLLKEKYYLPWKSFFNDISFIVQRYEGYNTGRDLLRKYILHLTSEIYNNIGFVDSISENHLDQLARELILTWVCKFNDTKCVDTSKNLFANWRQAERNTVSPNARPAVYCTALKHGSNEDWRFLWAQYLKTDFASEKKIILDALGCTLNKELLYEYIENALNVNYTSNIRKQDVGAALASVYNAGQFGLDVMLDYLLENYEQVHKYYGEWESVGELFLKVASRFSTKSQITKLQNFADTKKESITSISSVLDRALAAANKNYNWYSSNYKQIDSWLTWYQNNYIKSGTGRVVASAFSIISMTVLSIIVYISGR